MLSKNAKPSTYSALNVPLPLPRPSVTLKVAELKVEPLITVSIFFHSPLVLMFLYSIFLQELVPTLSVIRI